jgi:hypothetical protein
VQAIEARRDFWLAKVNLHVAIVGGGAGDAAGPSEPTTLASGTGGD